VQVNTGMTNDKVQQQFESKQAKKGKKLNTAFLRGNSFKYSYL